MWLGVAGVVLRCPEVSRVVTVGQDVGGVWECLSMSESVCWCLLVSIELTHPKSEKIGGDYLSAQKNWRKKCVNLDDKILRQKCVNHQNFMNFVEK